jgi:flagellar protein FliO/FliZ
MVELAVRLVFSLAVVVGLLLLTVKVGGRKFRPRNGAAVRIVHRQALSRGTAVAVVEVGNRVLVLGTTEHQVNVLAELEEGELDRSSDLTIVDSTLDPASQVIALEDVRATPPVHFEAALETAIETATEPAPRRRAGSHAARPAPKSPKAAKQTRRAVPTGPLAGSILSPQTWRQALGAASGRAS